MERRVTTAVAWTLALVSVGLLAANASAEPPLGSNDLAPATGDATTAFDLAPPTGASCTGSGTDLPEFRWQTYLVSQSVDASTLSYGATGPEPVVGAFVSPLFDSAGTPVIDGSPSALPVGLIESIPTFSFAPLVGGAITDGAYKIGFACTTGGVLDAGKYWETPITVSNVTPSGFDYQLGSVPQPPVLGSPLTADDGALSGGFLAAASNPPTTGYTVTAVPQGGGATVSLALATAGVFTMPGLVNATTYDVMVTATNSFGDSVTSNVVSGVPAVGVRPAVTGLIAVPATESIVVNWAPPTGPPPTGYTISVDPAVAGSPFTALSVTTSFVVPGLIGGTMYTVTVTPTHPVPFTAAPATAGPVAAFASSVDMGNISVIRPIGALVLTQRCGVFGTLPAEPASPGFGPLDAMLASSDQVGAAPLTPGGIFDPVFTEYPYPATPTYPTHCSVDLGIGRLVTSGLLAGQYFAASGRINQVTVVDTRDVDQGFTVNGTMSDFADGTSTFSGNYMGWSPVVTDDSDAHLDGYDQLVIAGAVATPGTISGLGSTRPLASAPAGSGLGIATLDARVKLLIPVTADAGTYTATLTLTTI
jgi:Fibronectin type III domain